MTDVAVVAGELVEDPDTSADRLLGVTCFDTIAFGPEGLVDGEAHLERLAKGARTIGIGPEGGWEAVDRAIETALEATDHGEGIVRVSLHARGEPVGLSFEDRLAEVQVLATAPRYEGIQDGVAAVTSTIPAPGPGWPAHVKAPCLPRTMAHREARGRGAFEGLLLDGSDRVVSGTRSNVFARVDDELVTPPSPPAFPGITRRRVLEAARRLELPARARPVPRSALDDAREIFVTFTGPSVVPLIELDGEPVGDPDWTDRLADELRQG